MNSNDDEKNSTMNKKEFLKETEAYFGGALEMMNDDDAPDGAWFQILINTADHLLESIEDDLEIKKPKKIDGHDVVIHWMDTREALK